MVQDREECLSENELLAWAAGGLPAVRVQALDAHIDACEQCQALVAEALRHTGDGEPSKPREDTFEADELIANRYRVVRFLARGGMGEVYEVHDLWLKENVALKTLVATISDDASALARLKAEVLHARRISHRNVCRVFDFGFHELRSAPGEAPGETTAFLTMELLRGETLRARLLRDKRLSLEDAGPIAAQITTALSHAHAAGVIHRDLKSDNVMLVDDGADGIRVVVNDFGLARSSRLLRTQPLTTRGRRLGTLDYMAPEQLLDGPLTQATDLYALGVVMFEMLTGRLPFEGVSVFARAWRRVRSDPARPRALVPEIPEVWEQAILKCLARKPEDRFQRAEDVWSFIEGGPRSVRSARRLMPILIGAVLVSGLAIALVVSTFDGDAGRAGGSPPDTAASASGSDLTRAALTPTAVPALPVSAEPGAVVQPGKSGVARLPKPPPSAAADAGPATDRLLTPRGSASESSLAAPPAFP